MLKMVVGWVVIGGVDGGGIGDGDVSWSEIGGKEVGGAWDGAGVIAGHGLARGGGGPGVKVMVKRWLKWWRRG